MHLTRTFRACTGAALAASSLALVAAVPALDAAPASAGTHCAASAIPHKGTVNLTFWEAMSSANETLIQRLVADFNKSQKAVHVTDVNQSGGYVQTWNSYVGSIGTSGEPNVVMLDQYITQGAVDSKSIIPVAECVAGTHYSTKTFAKKTILEETIGGKLQGLPYSVSAPILIYNKQAFTKAHISTAPVTVPEMATDAAALKTAGYKDGMTLSVDPWYLQVWQGIDDDYFVNNDNGRSSRANAAAFNDASGLTTLTDLQNIVKAGDATTNPSTNYNNLYAIGGGESGMTIDTSATLGTILGLLHDYPNVTLGVAEMPRFTPGVSGGVEPGGNALFLPSGSNASAAKLAASWEFIQYLDSAVNMATWDRGTGYVPIRSDAAKEHTMVAFYKKYPSLRAAYNEIMTGKVDDATAGPLLGDYYQVDDDLTTSLSSLFTSPYPSPSSVLSSAASKVTSDIQGYNASL